MDRQDMSISSYVFQIMEVHERGGQFLECLHNLYVTSNLEHNFDRNSFIQIVTLMKKRGRTKEGWSSY